MEDYPIDSQQVAIRIEPADLTVAPGSSVDVSLFLHNQSQADGSFELMVAGIPSIWVSVPSAVIRLAAGEQRAGSLTIQPPLPPEGQAGRHQVTIRLANQETGQATEATCTLTVAELVVPGRIGILMAATEFPVAPGESVTIPIVLLNQGLESDIVDLSVEGIPTTWVSASSQSTSLSPVQQQAVTLTIQPAASEESSAGQHPFKILAASQAAPGQVTEAQCILSITGFSQFECELRPERIEAGEPAWVVVDNLGNIEQEFSLTWQSPGDEVTFEPIASQILHIPPGEEKMAKFQAKARSRPLFGADRILAFTARVQPPDGEPQTLTGDIVGKALIPAWLAISALVVLLACVCLSVLGVVYMASQDDATPTLTPTTAVLPEAPTSIATPVSGDLWQQIQATGKIVAGTSVDYPPFEYYSSDNQVDGFDIALMGEIGRRLGVQVDFRDLAFDGLGPALRLGDIQVAIAAISRTPEREAEVDFSNVYLVSEDGFLARADWDVPISSIDDAAQYRIGVQRSTVYEEWIQLVLIDAGRMSPDNLYAYQRAEDAVRDLREGRLELVLLDVQPAQAFVNEGGLKLVAKGLNPQNYAIALPKGESALKGELDQVITALYNDGTVARLAQQYLGLPQVLPTPMPLPTSTAAPAPGCENGMSFIQDLTQEGDLKPGQAFTKGWQVRNSGTCTWNTGYHLVFAEGHNMGGSSVAIGRDVAPGETYDLWIDLVSPLNSGDYQGFWVMTDSQGVAFGERLQVNIRVTVEPTITPAPTQTPVAGILFTVDRDAIKAGECVNFSWKVDNVKEVYFYRDGQSWQGNGVAGEGSRVECPPATTTYYLRVVLLDNSVEVRQITIYVEPVADAPQITRFTVDPPGQITLGQCVTIRWQVDGQQDWVLLTANGAALWDGAPASGSYQDCPTGAGNVAYALEATGPGGTSRGQETITVVDAATATPAPTAAPDLPVIYSFVVDPAQIQAGECVAISWSVGGGTTYSRILRNKVVLIDDAGYSGQQVDCLDTEGDYTYEVEVENAAGEMVTEEQLVSVAESAP